MKRYLLLLMFILNSFSISTAQPLSIKWDHKFVEDSMGIGYIKVVASKIDINDKLLVQLENDWSLPAFWFFDSEGNRLFYKNQYFNRGDTSYFGRVALLTKPMRQHLTIITEFSDVDYFRVRTAGMAIPSLNLSHFREIEVSKNANAHNVTLLPLGTEQDILPDPVSYVDYKYPDFLAFCNSKYTDSIVRVSVQGVVKQKFPLKRDSILQKQNLIQAQYDNLDGSKIWMLSGLRATNHQTLFPKDSLFGFQLRTFTVNTTEHTLVEHEAVYFSEAMLQHPDRNFYPVRMVIEGDKIRVIGNSRSKTPAVTNLTDVRPFIATVDKNGNVIDCSIFDTTLAVNAICMSADSTSMLIGGRRLMKTDSLSYFYENSIIEFDFASKSQSEVSINRIPWASKRGSTVTSIDRYSNGDFSYTTWNDVSEDSSMETSSYVTIGRLTRTTTSAGDIPSLNTTVTVMPNPSSELATVEFMSSPDASLVQLVDIYGNVVKPLYKKETQNSHKSSVTFRVSDLANGMYYLVVGNGTKTLETVPLSIQR
jgi:hypothetical protein